MLVVKITPIDGGTFLALKPEELGALSSMVHSEPGRKYALEFCDMPQAEFDALGEFDGF